MLLVVGALASPPAIGSAPSADDVRVQGQYPNMQDGFRNVMYGAAGWMHRNGRWWQRVVANGPLAEAAGPPPAAWGRQYVTRTATRYDYTASVPGRQVTVTDAKALTITDYTAVVHTVQATVTHVALSTSTVLVPSAVYTTNHDSDVLVDVSATTTVTVPYPQRQGLAEWWSANGEQLKAKQNMDLALERVRVERETRTISFDHTHIVVRTVTTDLVYTTLPLRHGL